MKDWYLNTVYDEIASFHVPPVFYPPRRSPDGTTRARPPLLPQPPAMLAAVLRWIRRWSRDLRAVLKKTGAPIDSVPTDSGRTIDYTLTKWGLENIRLAPRWRRDEAILRRKRQEAKDAEVLASGRGDVRAADYRSWKLWLSQLAEDAEIRLGEKPGATLGVRGIERKRRRRTDHVPLIDQLKGTYKGRQAAEILEAEGFTPWPSVSGLLEETAVHAAVAAKLGLIEGRSPEAARRGAKIIRSRLDRDPLR